jgi:hypothetical protein
MQNKNQKTTELSSAELLEMFYVEELDDRLEMDCWMICQNSTNTCTIVSTSTNGTCCGNQTTGSPSVGVPVNISCASPTSPVPKNP